jgi:hypothetical protein
MDRQKGSDDISEPKHHVMKVSRVMVVKIHAFLAMEICTQLCDPVTFTIPAEPRVPLQTDLRGFQSHSCCGKQKIPILLLASKL